PEPAVAAPSVRVAWAPPYHGTARPWECPPGGAGAPRGRGPGRCGRRRPPRGGRRARVGPSRPRRGASLAPGHPSPQSPRRRHPPPRRPRHAGTAARSGGDGRTAGPRSHPDRPAGPGGGRGGRGPDLPRSEHGGTLLGAMGWRHPRCPRAGFLLLLSAAAAQPAPPPRVLVLDLYQRGRYHGRNSWRRQLPCRVKLRHEPVPPRERADPRGVGRQALQPRLDSLLFGREIDVDLALDLAPDLTKDALGGIQLGRVRRQGYEGNATRPPGGTSVARCAVTVVGSIAA